MNGRALPEREAAREKPDYQGRLASEQPNGPGYNTAPPATRDESVRTSGFSIVPGTRYGFFTDTTVCIGCKACEVACKQWNQLPMDSLGFTSSSYDQTRGLGATTWRHVLFVEQFSRQARTAVRDRWLFMSDVCKHCENAGCLEACPTGAIVRTEFGSVLIQQDICNGCKYCVPSCPFHVITVSHELDGTAHKCTLCYDRLKGGLEPACAKACPTDSILFGPVERLREMAEKRVRLLRDRGVTEAYLYGVPGSPGATGGVVGLNCFFLLTDRPEVYNLPAAPELPSTRATRGAITAAVAAIAFGAATILALRSAGKE